MLGFDIIDSTTRSGVTVDQVEFAVSGAPAATAYALGQVPGEVQPVVLGLHHERGDKATMLADLDHLAARGCIGVSLDSPLTRRAIADRDPVAAFDSLYAIAESALNLLQGDPELVDHRVALVGRGIGGEVAAQLAARTHRCQAVVAYSSLPERSHYVRNSEHPIAAGLRWARRNDGLPEMLAALEQRDLLTQLTSAPHIHWMLQTSNDDDRLDEHDRATLAMGIPHSVRVREYASMVELTAASARRDRADFITHLLT